MASKLMVVSLLVSMKFSIEALRHTEEYQDEPQHGDIPEASAVLPGKRVHDLLTDGFLDRPPHGLIKRRDGQVQHPKSSEHGHAEHGTSSEHGHAEHRTHAASEEEGDDLDTLVKTDPLQATDEEHGKPHYHGYKCILFFFGALVVGLTILMILERRLPGVPYTCALFVAGALLDLYHHYNKAYDNRYAWPSWFFAMEKWEAIDPHTLFYCFLPALLFSEAMKLNVQMVGECFWQVFLLACPGVLFGTCAIAAFAHYMLPYGWDWPVALVFGSIVSATDPVAVVALFNTLGVSPRLTMLVSGESLLNDGTAIVVFTLMLKVAMGVSLSPWTVFAFFGHMTLVSTLLGFTISVIGVLVIRKCAEDHYKNDMMVQVISTICTAYLSFFIAESEVSTSGVLTTVTAGFVIAYCAWPSFVSSHTMHTVWDTIEFVGNTVIFFLAGIKFMAVIMHRRDSIDLIDWFWLLVLYVALTVVRALMIAVMWKPLNALGHPITYKEAMVMVWSGLRGAVSLSLALIVDLGPIGESVGPYVLFHVGGITALTFLINATTASSLLSWLGLTKTKESRERILAQFMVATARGIQAEFSSQLKDERFMGAEGDVVRGMVPALRADIMSPRRADHTEEHEKDELRQVYRQALLRLVMHHYHDTIEKGIIPRNLDVSRQLLLCTEKADAKTDRPLRDWELVQAASGLNLPVGILAVIQKALEFPPFKWSTGLHDHFGAKQLMVQKVFASLFFQEAHHHAREELPKFFGSLDTVSLKLQEEVFDESKAQCALASAFLEAELQAQQIDYLTLAKSEILARHLLQQQLESVTLMQEMGIFTDAETEGLLEGVQVARRALTHTTAGARAPTTTQPPTQPPAPQ